MFGLSLLEVVFILAIVAGVIFALVFAVIKVASFVGRSRIEKLEYERQVRELDLARRKMELEAERKRLERP